MGAKNQKRLWRGRAGVECNRTTQLPGDNTTGQERQRTRSRGGVTGRIKISKLVRWKSSPEKIVLWGDVLCESEDEGKVKWEKTPNWWKKRDCENVAMVETLSALFFVETWLMIKAKTKKGLNQWKEGGGKARGQPAGDHVRRGTGQN